METTWNNEHGDEVQAEHRDDGWYWRWTSSYAPDREWHGPCDNPVVDEANWTLTGRA
jgi:hypothetical protein